MSEIAPRAKLRTRFKPTRLKLSSDHSKRPLDRMSLHDQLVAKVREMIVDGELQAGAPLPEKMLCETFGVSRTPLREAFKILASEGLIELRPSPHPCRHPGRQGRNRKQLCDHGRTGRRCRRRGRNARDG